MKKITIMVLTLTILSTSSFAWMDYNFGTSGNNIASIVMGPSYVGFSTPNGNILGMNNLTEPWSAKAKAFYSTLLSAQAQGKNISICFTTATDLGGVIGRSEDVGKYFFTVTDIKIIN